MPPKHAIFITGATSLNGAALARRFSQAGWFVGMADRDEQALEDAEARLASGFSYSHAFDTRDPSAWDHALDTFAVAAGGHIHVLANMAQEFTPMPMMETSSGLVAEMLDINLAGAIHGARAAFPFLQKTAPGSCMINLVGQAALYGPENQAVFAAAQAGLVALSQSLDAEWRGQGIAVHALIAGRHDTPPDAVAQAAWQFARKAAANAANAAAPVTLVGKYARKMAFAARWAPGRLRRLAQDAGNA